MHPIAPTDPLPPGTTLFHSAFGFAVVQGASDDGVELDWERNAEHLPRRVPWEQIRRVYARCAPAGFFERALRDPDGLRDALHAEPTEQIAMMLDELDGPQRVRDLMDWLVGRSLFTPKTFVRWWGSNEGRMREDGRLTFDGEWVRRAGGDGDPLSLSLSQLEPSFLDDRTTPERTTGEASATAFAPLTALPSSTPGLPRAA